MSNEQLILASQSPRRRELLSLLGLPFAMTTSNVRETRRAGESPAELATRLSRAKAHAVEENESARKLVIACDTIVVLQEDGSPRDAILGKPRNAKEATEMLERLRGRSHIVYSAATVWRPNGGTVTDLVKTKLTMREYSEAEVVAYVASGDPLDKAGAYAIQHEGFDPVRQVQGCYASVMGLPLCHLAVRLRASGVNVTTDVPAVCQAHTDHLCRVYQRVWTS